MFVRQYRPTFFEGFENWEGQVNSWPELVALKWVENFATQPKFHRFSLHRHYYDEPDEKNWHHLMAEYNEGREWWIVANLIGTDSELEALRILPEWEPKEEVMPVPLPPNYL